MAKSPTPSNLNNFAIGDQVVLKSGGPDMTIKQITDSDIVCQWFAGKKLEQGRFAPESITKSTPKP
jgi:uncharacterized protein YodC (DUF2158 family)